MRTENRGNYRQRLNDAAEFMETAKQSLSAGRLKSAVMAAGDAAIAANDAFTIFRLGEKASSDHREAIILHKKAGQNWSENRAELLKRLINQRHSLGYAPVEVSSGLAASLVKDAGKFIEWVKISIVE